MRMNNALVLIVVAMIGVFVLSGCATDRGFPVVSSLSNGKHVFSEAVGPATEPGMALVDFSFSLKSNAARFVGIHFKHSNPPYRVQLTIDGQTTIVAADPIWEERGAVNSIGPECGAGWRYRFKTRLTIAPGEHELSIALPADDVTVEREIVVHAGENAIIARPVYKKKLLRPYKGHNFSAGIKTLEVLVNATDGPAVRRTCFLESAPGNKH